MWTAYTYSYNKECPNNIDKLTPIPFTTHENGKRAARVSVNGVVAKSILQPTFNDNAQTLGSFNASRT